MCESVRPAQPAGAARDWRDIRNGGAVWARRGEVFAVHASGNAPGVHGLWPQALAFGYRVAVRPSRREPFTGQRLITALRESGFRAEDVVLSAHRLRRCRRDHPRGGPRDGLRRPGRRRQVRIRSDGLGQRSRAREDSDHRRTGLARPSRSDRRLDLRLRRDGVRQHHRGALRGRCRSAGARRSRNDSRHWPRCRSPTSAPCCPSCPRAPRRPSRDFLGARAAGTTPLLGADQVVADFGDGTAALRPAVHLLAAPDPSG